MNLFLVLTGTKLCEITNMSYPISDKVKFNQAITKITDKDGIVTIETKCGQKFKVTLSSSV